ncbi:hypothetical protein KBB68_00660 [Candidatus Babeliales bacterium]|nr:hypothetical protein [Candidatus Babeliales bacterium]
MKIIQNFIRTYALYSLFLLSSMFFSARQRIQQVPQFQQISQIQQIQNLVEVLKYVKSLPPLSKQPVAPVQPITLSPQSPVSGSQGAQVNPPIQIPSTPIALPAFNVNGSKCSAPFTAVSVAAGAAYNATALSCSGGLQLINIALTDANVTDWNASLTIFGDILSNSVLMQLMQQGMYIAINMLLNPAGNTPGNYIQINLTDVSGNLYAQSPLVQLPAGIGFAYANVGFNVEDTQVGMGSNQTYVNWMPIVNGQAIFYKDQGTATTVTTPGIGGQVSIPPVTKQLVSTLRFWGTDPTDDFIVTGNGLPANMATVVDSRQNGTAFACQGGLQFINVGLIGLEIDGGWACRFNIEASPKLQQLAQQGLYVVVTTYQQSGNNIAAVSLTDQNANIYAQKLVNIPANSGFTWINIGYNKHDTLSSLQSNQVYVNWIRLTANTLVASWYQDQGPSTSVSTASIGGLIAPLLNSQQGNLQPGAVQLPFILAAANINNPCTFQAPGLLTFTSSVAATLSGTPFSCQSGLRKINIGISDTGSCFASFNFDKTILGQPEIQTLMNNGMYIGVNTNAATNTIVAMLMDQNGKIYAQGTMQLPAKTGGKIQFWNLGLNTNDSNVVDGKIKLGYNEIGLSKTVLYKQLPNPSQPQGAVLPPQIYGPGAY